MAAKEEHKKEVGSEGKGPKAKKEKLKLRAITTTKADDGSFIHEHHYEGKDGQRHPARFGGSSSNMQDLHDHMEDHMGGGEGQGDDGDEGSEPGDQEQQAGAPNAGAAGPEEPE